MRENDPTLRLEEMPLSEARRLGSGHDESVCVRDLLSLLKKKAKGEILEREHDIAVFEANTLEQQFHVTL